MKDIKSFLLESEIDYMKLAQDFWESEADLEEYEKLDKKDHAEKEEAQELGLTDGEYQCLKDYCNYLHDKRISYYSFWIDGPHADKNAPEDWHESLHYLMMKVYNL